MSLPASSTESKPSVHSITHDFSAAIGSGHAIDTSAVKALQACQAAGLKPTRELFNHVLAAHSGRSPPETVISWFAKMRVSVPVDCIACNIALKAHVSRGDLQSAAAMLTTMMRDPSQRDGLPMPDVVSFNTVINGLAQGKEPAKAEALLIAMIDFGLCPPTSGTYASVVAAFARASNPASAEKWLGRMLEATSPMTESSSEVVGFNATMLAYANANDAAGALRVLATFESRARDECPNAAPDVISYNTVISACAKAGQPAQAEKTFNQMLKAGIAPNNISYSTVIHAHAHAGNAAKAQSWLDKMLQHGIAADAISFNSVCAVHAKRGDVQAALTSFNAMMRGGVTPSPQTHSIMINALVQAGNAEQAEASLRVLLQSGERLEAAPFNSIISLHGKNGMPFRAEAVLILMGQAVPPVRPTLVTFNSLASAHALAGDVEAVERILAQAAAPPFRFALDRYSYGAALQAISKQRDAARGRQDPQVEQARLNKARVLITQLWASSVNMNDYLESACRRALGGQRHIDQLKAELGTRRGSEPQRSARRQAGDSQAAASRPSAAAASAGGGRVTRSKSPSCSAWGERAWTVQQQKADDDDDDDADDDEDAEGDGDDDDGWTTVATKKGRGSDGKRSGSKAKSPAASKSIAKKPSSPFGLRLTRNRSSEAISLDEGKAPAPAVARVVGLSGGVPLTRSRSATQRSLLALAEDAVEAEFNGEADASGSLTADLPDAYPLKRSAASQLALDLASGMDF